MTFSDFQFPTEEKLRVRRLRERSLDRKHDRAETGGLNNATPLEQLRGDSY